jgi:hypothetical protein
MGSKKRNIEIRLIKTSKEYETRDLQDEVLVREIINDNIIPKLEDKYFRIDAKIKRNSDKSPKQIVAYLLRKDIYLAEVATVDLTNDFEVKEIKFGKDYVDEDEEEDEDEEPDIREFAVGFDIIVSTPVPEISTAKAAVEKLNNEILPKAGFKCKMLLGKDATIANYKQYLASGLKGFVNIGHGNTTGIALYDGFLSNSWFQSLANKPLAPSVVYFNSCQVHNEPFKSAVINAGARTFIGGIVNLAIGPSEEVCKCFWERSLNQIIRMDDALHQCEKEKYPSQGAHGISGDLGLTSPWQYGKTVIRTHAKVGSKNTWALLNGSSWLYVSPNSIDGVSNIFQTLCEAMANNRKVDVYLPSGQIEQVTMI